MSHQPSMLATVLTGIDCFAEWTGKTVSLLILVMMVLTCTIVVLRYGFSLGSIVLQESVGYLHAVLFLSAMAFTLKQDGHVRVDIFYRRLNRNQKAWVNAVGSLIFLLPVCSFIVYSSWDFVINSWRVKESSPNAGGIPMVYLLKTLIPVAAILLALQGGGEVLRSLLQLMPKKVQPND